MISYPTVLEVDNDDLSLRPGMTGTAEITTLTREQALLVPNAALRFTPAPAAAARQAPSRSVVGSLMPRPPATTPRAQAPVEAPATPRVWVLRDGEPAAVDVETGATNGKRHRDRRRRRWRPAWS